MLKRIITLNAVTIFVFLLFCITASANPVRDEPYVIQQPNGQIIDCFMSGDEYFNYIHDADGYLIKKDEETGYYVYVDFVDGEITTSTNNIVTNTVPNGLSAMSGSRITVNDLPDSYILGKYESTLPESDIQAYSGGTNDIVNKFNEKTFNNLVIFIEFADTVNEFPSQERFNFYSDVLNGSDKSLKNYYKEITYNKTNVNNILYGVDENNQQVILRYRDSQVRDYYKDKKLDYRENLMHKAIDDVADKVKGLNLDSNNDGIVDCITFIVDGEKGEWGTFFWNSRTAYNEYVEISDLKINNMVFILDKEKRENEKIEDVGISKDEAISVLAHETLHVLGFPDLYHYNHDGEIPVSAWDMMGSSQFQHPSAYMKMKYGNWLEIDKITESKRVTLNSLASESNNSLIFESPYSSNEYIVIEYRKKDANYDVSIPESGLVIYKINKNFEGKGNKQNNRDNYGSVDEVQVYADAPDKLNAAFSASGNIYFGIYSKPAAKFSNGNFTGLTITNISEAGDTISFDVKLNNKVWDFGSSPFAKTTEINSDMEIDGMNFYADLIDVMNIEEDDETRNGFEYKRRLSLEGGRDGNSRMISFPVNGDCNIYITATSSSNEDRTLIVDAGGEEYSICVGEADTDIALASNWFKPKIFMKTHCIQYRGGATEIYMYSQKKDIHIYSIAVEEVSNNAPRIPRDWNIADSWFFNLVDSNGKTDTVKRVNGLNIMPEVEFNYINGTMQRVLRLNNSGSIAQSSVCFSVYNEAYIQFTAQSTGGDRKLILVNDKGWKVAEIPVGSAKNTVTVKYNGDDDILYLYSLGGGVEIFEISIDKNGGTETPTMESEPVTRIDRTGYTLKRSSEIIDSGDDRLIINNDEATSASSLSVSILKDEVTSGNSLSVGTLNDENSYSDSVGKANVYYAASQEDTPSDNRYYKQLVDYDTKQLYKLLYNELLRGKNFEEDYEISFDNMDLTDTPSNRGIIVKKVKTALSAFLADYPQVFWVNTFDYSFDLYTKDNTTWIYNTTLHIKRSDNGSWSESMYSANITEMEKKGTIIAEDANENAYSLYAPYEKIRYIFDRLNEMYTLTDDTGVHYYNNASGALVYGRANSFGVASTFKFLCDKAGIECLYAEGYAGNDSAAYNLVKLDGEWYLCDAANDKLMVAVPDEYLLLNPSRYGDSANNVQIFTYPSISEDNYLKLGDVNTDGRITGEDSAYALQYFIDPGKLNLTYKQKLNADVDEDGEITEEDADLILQMTLGIASVTMSDVVTRGVEVSEVNNSELDVDGNGIIDADDMTILVLSLNDNGVETFSMTKTYNRYDETKQKIINAFS